LLRLLQTITAQYLMFVFPACVGAVQLAAARAGAERLLLLGRRGASAALGALLIVGGYVGFFARAPYTSIGLEGAQLFGWFVATALAAVLACAGGAALRGGRMASIPAAASARVRAGLRELRSLPSAPARPNWKDQAGR
jgi:hypothetical protein